MTGERLAQMGWPYQGQPINVDFDVNWDSEQARGLVAWWPMIGSQGGWPVPDRALYRYPMTPFNTPTWVSDGKRGWSVLFDDAAQEYLSIDTAIMTAPPFSVSCWFYTDSAVIDTCLVSIADNGTPGNYHYLQARGTVGGDPISAATNDGVFGVANTTTGYTINTWHHAVGVWKATNSRAAYIDGGGKGTSAVNSAPPGLTTTAIGRMADSTPSRYMSGMIADVRIYNRALTDTEVYNLYANPWELYAPRIYQQRAYVAAAAGAIMNQIQYSNLGADLFDGALIL